MLLLLQTKDDDDDDDVVLLLLKNHNNNNTLLQQVTTTTTSYYYKMPLSSILTQKAMAKPVGLTESTFYRQKEVVETKDTFIESIERLSSEHRSTQQAMAKALRLPFPTFRSKAHRYGIKWRDYFVEDKLLQEEKKRKREEETEGTETKVRSYNKK